MELEPIYWLLLTLLCIVGEGFYSMQEMALVSLNRLDLVYELAKGSRRAQWISKLVHHPDRLFTTTLLTSGLFLQLGSECSRRLYLSLNLSSELALLSQAVLVIICAELAPTLAARQHALSVSLLGSPLLYATSQLLSPVIFVVRLISNGVQKMVGLSQQRLAMVSREDVLTVVGRVPLIASRNRGGLIRRVGGQIFAMHQVSVGDVCESIHTITVIDPTITYDRLRELMIAQRSKYALMIDPITRRPLGVVLPRSLLKRRESVLAFVQPLLSLKVGDKLLEVIQPLRTARYAMAVVVDREGAVVGILTFDGLDSYLFGSCSEKSKIMTGRLIERTVELHLLLDDLKQQFQVVLEAPGRWTLERFLTYSLQRPVEIGDTYEHEGTLFEVLPPMGNRRQPRVRVRAFL